MAASIDPAPGSNVNREAPEAVAEKNSRLMRNAAFAGAASLSVVLGFAHSLHKSKQTELMKKGKPEEILRLEAGTRLATRALLAGTIVSMSGVTLLFYTTFKLFGVNNFHEFNAKMREYFPKPPPRGRTEFKNLKELADYLVSEDSKAEKLKNEQLKKSSVIATQTLDES